MSARRIRFIANAIITVFCLLIIVARIMTFSASGYHWLWGASALLIAVLDVYFLTRSMLHEPKNIDTGLITFFISVSGSMGFALSAFVVGYPLLDFPHVELVRHVGGVISVLPYPFIFWALFCLKDCLTVIPEAHTIVAHGIYKYSRHPLYMCYIGWNIANMMMFPSLLMLSLIDFR